MNTVRIPLTRGQFALIDEADLPLVSNKKWTLHKQVTGRMYATHYFREDGRVRAIAMHRLIAGDPALPHIDHLNGDGLDNRRSNLRAVSQSENLRNRSTTKHNGSGVLNVVRCRKRFGVTLRIDGRNRWFGTYDTLEEAAAVAYQARLQHYGPQAVARLPKPAARTPERTAAAGASR